MNLKMKCPVLCLLVLSGCCPVVVGDCRSRMSACGFSTLASLKFGRIVSCRELDSYLNCMADGLLLCLNSELAGGISTVQDFLTTEASYLLDRCGVQIKPSCSLRELPKAMFLCIGTLYNVVVIKEDGGYGECLAVADARKCVDTRVDQCRDSAGQLSERHLIVLDSTIARLERSARQQGICSYESKVRYETTLNSANSLCAYGGVRTAMYPTMLLFLTAQLIIR